MNQTSVVPAHTAGPWTLRPDEPVAGRSTVFGESRDIAIILPWMGTMEADGALIAAAPCLLEALEAQIRAEQSHETYLAAMSAVIGVSMVGNERGLREEAQRQKAHALVLREKALSKARAAA